MNEKEIKKAKGVRRVTLDKEIHYSDYYDVYTLVQKEISKWQSRIASKKHTISTLNYNKKVLSIWEDKRAWITENSSLPYGNYKLENSNLPKKVNLPKRSLPQRCDILNASDSDHLSEDIHDDSTKQCCSHNKNRSDNDEFTDDDIQRSKRRKLLQLK